MSDMDKDILETLQKMQQQLNFLEKKLDTLLQQTQNKPSFNRDRNFSKPFRPWSKPNRPDGGHPNDQRPRPHGQGNFQKKKPFFGRHRDR